MDIDRFRALAEAYGGAMDRWPQDERDAARIFARAHPETAAILADAAALDAMLAEWTLPPTDDLLRARLLRDARRTIDQAPYPRRIAVAQAAAVILCLVVGAAVGTVGVGADEDVDVIEAALGGEEEWG